MLVHNLYSDLYFNILSLGFLSYVVVRLMSYQLSTKVHFCPQMLKLIYLFSIFTDKPGGQRSAGAPSFIIQEEFDRYTGYWWQPNAKEGDDIETVIIAMGLCLVYHLKELLKLSENQKNY